jgi:ParB family chromosome partitioning protein
VPRTPRGLGRGLAGMIDAGPPNVEHGEEPGQEDPGGARLNRQIEVGVDEIVPNTRQPRHSFNPDRLRELADSIAQDGLVQPVVVRRQASGYELIAGERRWRAAKAAGLTRIPAILRDADDREALLLAIVENVVRADLNPVEVARGYASLVDELGLGASDVARRVGRSRSAVANTLRLLDLPDDVLESITKGDLTEGHGRAILQSADRESQRELAAHVVRRGLTVRQTEALARRAPPRARASRAGADDVPPDDDLVNDLTDALLAVLGTTPTVRRSTHGVRVEFEVVGADGAARLLQALTEGAAGDGDGSH